MIELLLTSFPVIIRYFQLKRRGEPMSVWNMRVAVFMWAAMAFALFVVIFYFHPKSYSGVLPFRTVSVVSQVNGPVTEVAVTNGQHVSAGDLLFRIEDSAQRADLNRAEAELAALSSDEAKVRNELLAAEASVMEATAALDLAKEDLGQAMTLLERNVGTQDAVRTLQAEVAVDEARLAAAQASVTLAQSEISEGLPARRRIAEASLESARAALDKTSVHTVTDGVVTQLALGPGSPASQLILSPAMVIIPDRDPEMPVRITAGFSQVARSTLHEGMAAEIACDSNMGLSFRNTVLPAHISSIQPAVAAGQIVPGGRLLEPQNLVARGSLVAYLELVHPEHEAIMLNGSGCLVQTYTTTLPGLTGHIIAATGVVKAVGLRLKVWGALIAGIGLSGGGH
ncbi:HlyD family secretion protein [Pseudooceanicola nanhaiensis]|uniref:HlyD family secretion protein n=1 Tax=Pseudooceanicola nanhaiensis TaxID=375761 RepID=UPI001CD25EB3|nr:biotin/lipoyl-binding protein [Pseudooceanicola nanhaiensis]MCA0922856.1 biotin/lipoyl-binding protein [Pseudooceanicola nanhaiensis]